MALFPCIVLDKHPSGLVRIGMSSPAVENNTLRYRELDGSGRMCGTYVGHTCNMTRLVSVEAYVRRHHKTPEAVYFIRLGGVQIGRVLDIDPLRNRVRIEFGGRAYLRKLSNCWVKHPQWPDITGERVPDIASLVRTPELCSLEHAGLKRGYILWCPTAPMPPKVVHTTLAKAQEVQRIMAVRHPGQVFHICPVGPGLSIEVVTTHKETVV